MPVRNSRNAQTSHAVMNGESLHVAGCLPGHRRAGTTNRYVRLDDVTLSHAAGRPAPAIGSTLRAVPRAGRDRQGSPDNTTGPRTSGVS